MRKLFIGNIPFSASESELEQWFSENGRQPSSVAIVRHRLTGDSRGFGFADFSEVDQAEKAVEELNGGEFHGRRLMLSVARSEGPAVQVAGSEEAAQPRG